MHNLAAALLISAYGLFCYYYWRRGRLTRAPIQPAALHSGSRVLLGVASQTGQALQLAQQAAHQLAHAGVISRILPLNAITPAHMAEHTQALYVVSTYGEGEAPDNASQFLRNLQHLTASALQHLQFGVFALGDSRYEHFCGFGHQLQQTLCAKGARPWFSPLELDRQASANEQPWHQHLTHYLSHLNGAEDLPIMTATAEAATATATWQQWTLSERQHLNPGSPGAPLFRLRLRPAQGAALRWQPGDVLEVQVNPPPDAPEDSPPLAPRSYTIASLPQHGYIELVVRQRWSAGKHALPQLGPGSGWLTQHAPLTSLLSVRRLANPAPPLDPNKPWILLGAGSGIAGVLAQLHARAQGPHSEGCWVIFGERDAQADLPYADLLANWQRQGMISRLDKTFSQLPRKPNGPCYVQDIVHSAAESILAWIINGAQIYVCGSRAGLGVSVHEALVDLVGELKLTQMHTQGHYWRDVY